MKTIYLIMSLLGIHHVVDSQQIIDCTGFHETTESGIIAYKKGITWVFLNVDGDSLFSHQGNSYNTKLRIQNDFIVLEGDGLTVYNVFGKLIYKTDKNNEYSTSPSKHFIVREGTTFNPYPGPLPRSKYPPVVIYDNDGKRCLESNHLSVSQKSDTALFLATNYLGTDYIVGIDGVKLFDLNYEVFQGFKNGIAIVARRDVYGELKWGSINTKGDVILPLKYNYKMSNFYSGLSAVENDNKKYGFIDQAGKLVLGYKYDAVYGGFDSTGCLVKLNNEIVIINKQGDIKYRFVENDKTKIIGPVGVFTKDLEGNYLTTWNAQRINLGSLGVVKMSGFNQRVSYIEWYEDGKLESGFINDLGNIIIVRDY